MLADPAFAVPALKPGLEVQFRADPTVFDGRYANNGWLQECPKPITELTWDNAAIVSPATAAKLDLTNTFAWTAGEKGRMIADLAKLTVNGKTSRRSPSSSSRCTPTTRSRCTSATAAPAPASSGPARRRGPLGQGFNTYVLRTSDSTGNGSGAGLTKAGDTYHLACVRASI